MSFFVYLAVVLFAAASALFGLDLMTAPLPPSKPSVQVASTSTPSNKLDRREAEQKAAAKQASNSDRALTPIYPANPAAKPNVRMVYPPTNSTTGGAVNVDDRSAPTQPQTDQAAIAQPETKEPAAQPPAPDATTAAAESATPAEATSTPVAEPVAAQTTNRCDVQACASAYRSFRESDCTFQPYEGPRRVCEAPPATQRSAARTRPWATEDSRFDRAARQARRDADLRSTREMTDEDDDGAYYGAPPIGQRRVIVIERSAGSFGFWR